MDVFEALYTTRAMRRVKPDPIPEEIQKAILDAAIRAPTGGNAQNWRFMLVDDPGMKGELGPLYRECLVTLWGGFYKERIDAAEANPDDPEGAQFLRVKKSADWLGDNFEQVPLFFFAFCEGDPSGGSIFPAVWNAMLAARAHGVGSSLTSAFMFKLDAMRAILGLGEADSNWLFSACVSMGYPTGRWGTAPRTPAHEVAYRNGWGQPVGFEIPEPLWKG